MDSDYLIKLFKAFTNKDDDLFYQIAWEIIKNEEKKKHHMLSSKLKQLLKDNSIAPSLNNIQHILPVPRDNEKGFRLLDVKDFYLDWKDVILEKNTKEKLILIIKEWEIYIRHILIHQHQD